MEEDSFLSKLDSGAPGVKYIVTDEELFLFLDECVNEVIEFSGESYSVSLALLVIFEFLFKIITSKLIILFFFSSI